MAMICQVADKNGGGANEDNEQLDGSCLHSL